MKTLTITSSKGGLGKSLITANIGAAIASKGKKVILVEGDPTSPLQLMLDAKLERGCLKLEDVVKKDYPAQRSVYPTRVEGLFLLPSGISLEDYYSLNAVNYAKKLNELEADYVFVDVPSPLGEAAFLSLGFCQYFLILLSEETISLSVEAAIDTIHLGKSHLKCNPIGFVLNKVSNKNKTSETLVQKIEAILGISCLGRINYSKIVAESFGVYSKKSYLAYEKMPSTDFHNSMDRLSDIVLNKLPKPPKKDPVMFLKKLTK